uniref:CSRP2 protein n=1 Tax=Fopius arisanus TaxID=64838 RepID=A0A0C9QZF5_9HYME
MENTGYVNSNENQNEKWKLLGEQRLGGGFGYHCSENSPMIPDSCCSKFSTHYNHHSDSCNIREGSNKLSLSTTNSHECGNSGFHRIGSKCSCETSGKACVLKKSRVSTFSRTPAHSCVTSADSRCHARRNGFARYSMSAPYFKIYDVNPRNNQPVPHLNYECFGGGVDCQRCGLKVYQAEMHIASGVPYHNICFSCYCCRKSLETLTYHESCGEIYCKQCYIRNFGPQGYGYSGVLQTPM